MSGNRDAVEPLWGIRGGSSLEAVTTGAVPDLPTVMGMAAGMGTGELITAFCAWMSSRAMSSTTVKRRRLSVTGFARFVEPITLATVGPTDVEEWLSTKRAANTRHAYRSDLAVFYGWGVRRRVFDHNPIDDTDSIRVPKSLPRPIPTDPAGLDEIIRCAPPHVRTALVLAAYAGLRRAEICALTTSDVVLGGKPPMLYVRAGKGKKDRAVPLHPTVLAHLARAGLPHGARYVPITPDALGHAVADHLRRCGIDATLHQGRHSFGTELARVTDGNVDLVRRLMGHDHLSTTLGYVALNAPGGTAIAAMYDDERHDDARRRAVRTFRRTRPPAA